MRWSVGDLTINQLRLEGEDIIYPWGVECADRSTFFSLERGVGYRYDVLEQEQHASEKSNRYSLRVSAADGEWTLKGTDKLLTDKITREVKLECIEPTLLMDFVMRFRFRKEHFDLATIAGTSIRHTDSRRNHQFETDSVRLHGDSCDARISVQEHSAPEKLTPHMYVRDQSEEWVVHARMLPNMADEEVIKLCNSWAGTRPLPQWVSDRILSSERIKSALWYRGEREPFENAVLARINPNAFPLVRLDRGQHLSWSVDTTFSIDDRENQHRDTDVRTARYAESPAGEYFRADLRRIRSCRHQ
jgi:hypothetical protein